MLPGEQETVTILIDLEKDLDITDKRACDILLKMLEPTDSFNQENIDAILDYRNTLMTYKKLKNK